MRYTIHRRTERPKTRRRRDYEVVQGPSHRFEAATPEVGKRLGVGQGTLQHRSAPSSWRLVLAPIFAAIDQHRRSYKCHSWEQAFPDRLADVLQEIVGLRPAI